MAAPRALRRFPFDLNLGTDICHVVRIRGILGSSRGARFVQKILNHEETRHPKIRRLLQNQGPHDSENMREPRRVAFPDVVQGGTSRPLKGGPSAHELQAAATFMAGRYDHLNHLSPREHQSEIGVRFLAGD